MTFQIAFTLAVLVTAIWAFASQRWRSDLIALLVMLSLVISGVLTPQETFSAFGQPVIVIVAAAYVLGGGLYETGLGNVIGNLLLRVGGHSETRVMLVIMLTAAILTSILSPMLTVVLLMPAVLRMAHQTRIEPSRLLLPLVTIATVGSQLTLIGATSNLMVNDIMTVSGQGHLGFFSLTPYALVSVSLAMLWFLLPGRWLLPRNKIMEAHSPSLDEVEQSYRLDNLLYRLRVRSGSDLVGQCLDRCDLRAAFHLNVIAVQPKLGEALPADPHLILKQDSLLIVQGRRGDVAHAASMHELEMKEHLRLDELGAMNQDDLRLAEVMVPFRSSLIGKTLAEIEFRQRYGLIVLAIHRLKRVVRADLHKHVLTTGDTLLIYGSLKRIQQVGEDLNLVPIGDLGPKPGERVTAKAGLALMILGAMVGLVVSGVMSLAAASAAAAVALIMTDCLSIERAYRQIDGKVLIVIGGMLPLSMALQKTGAAEIIARLLASFDRFLAPMGMFLLLYLFTIVITQVISNTVAAAIMIPIALNLATAQHLPPEPFGVAMTFAVCTSQITPLTHSENLLVRQAGRYNMRDYLINGLPIYLLQMMILVLWLV